jgi:hypothetical protein
MNRETFESYMDEPALLDAAATALLKGIIEEYPFCQAAHLLYARNLKNLQHIAYSSQLRVAAAYAGNRSMLKNLLQAEPPGQTTIEITADITEVSPQKKAVDWAQDEEVFSDPIPDPEMAATPTDTDQSADEILSNDEIINRFIETQPQITRTQQEFFNPANYAKQSAIDSETIVSETLAEIFLKQGHTEKAIKVYRKLSLVIPEKSAYFAALIKKIEKEHK